MKPSLPCFLSVLLTTGTTLPAAPTQYRAAEFSFEARDAHPGQPLGVRFSGRFTGPDGSVYDVPGFWDGGRIWRLRFAPPAPGEWTFETEATETESRVFEELHAGETMRGNEPARQVDVALPANGELTLVVNDGGDGSNYDHADWGDAHFVMRDGSLVYLDTLEPLSTSQGHGKLALRTNIPGHPLRIADRTFERGLGTHAPGKTAYPLDGSAVRFRAWVGVDALVREKGSVRFSVLVSRRSAERVGRHDPGLHGKSGRFVAAPAAGDNALFRHGGILRVSRDGHSLTHSDGTPFFWLGDTWWFCPSDLVPIDGSTNPEIPSAYEDLIQLRKRQGFTTVHMAFLGTIDGNNPYHSATRGPDLNPAYWQKVDRYMDYANENGILPVIGMGWAGRPLSPEDWRSVWRHLIARYGSHAVTWLVCGEYNVRGTDEIVDQTMDLAGFIKETDPYRRAMTIHPWAQGAEKRQAWDKTWYDFIMIQGGHGGAPPARLYLDAYNRQPTRPVLEGECQYEGIHQFTDVHVRNVAYRAIQSGSFGFTYGSQGLWYPTQNEQDEMHKNWGTPLVWWKAARRPGAEQMGHLRRIYETTDWWRLAPAPDAVVLLRPFEEEGIAVVSDLVARFAEAKPANAHWAKLSDNDADSISLHPAAAGEAVLSYPAFAPPEIGQNERLLLVLAFAISRKANLEDPKHPADGVRFSVKANGREIFGQHSRSQEWSYQAIDLTPFAGKPIELALVTAAGENMNWDHAQFRRPVVVTASKDSPAPGRDDYLRVAPRAVLAKADGTRTFVVYVAASPGPVRHRLADLPPGARYAATWHDPRTGDARPAAVGAVTESSLILPQPPDEQDWVLILRQQ